MLRYGEWIKVGAVLFSIHQISRINIVPAGVDIRLTDGTVLSVPAATPALKREKIGIILNIETPYIADV